MRDEWVKSAERLPEPGQRCIVAWADQAVPHTATLFEDEQRPGGTKWIASNGHTVRFNPTHWMPCPPMPAKEKNT